MNPPPEIPELRPAWATLRRIAAEIRADWAEADVDREIVACQNSAVQFGTVLAEVAKQWRADGPLTLRHLLPRRLEAHGTVGLPTNPEYLAKKAELTTKGTP